VLEEFKDGRERITRGGEEKERKRRDTGSLSTGEGS